MIKGFLTIRVLVVLEFLLVASLLCAQSETRLSGYAISDPITINTMLDVYSDYRVVPVALAPNPVVLQIPEGGYGYAWYVVEGLINGTWLPVMNTVVVAEDYQGNQLISQTRLLPYQFLSSIVHMQNLGVFAIPIPYNVIDDGSPGSIEMITVKYVNGQQLTPEHMQSIMCCISPYKYTAKWGYRLYAKGGIGATSGVVTATGYAGGGSGASISLDLEGLNTNPEWSSLKINRRYDMFLGEDVDMGPPRLINVGNSTASIEGSFPYEIEYEFDMDNLSGCDALAAFHLLMEPIPGSQLAHNFMSWLYQTLTVINANESLNCRRVSDEAGMDIEGNIGYSTDKLMGLPLGLEMSPGLGANAHFGASVKNSTDGNWQGKLSLRGGFDFNTNIGPKTLPLNNGEFKFFYPQSLEDSFPSLDIGVEYEVTGSGRGNILDDIKMSNTIETNLESMNTFNLPGQVQGYTSYLNIDNEAAKNLLLNATQTPLKAWNIGKSAVSMVTNNETFKQDYTNFLSSVYTEQNSDLPVQIGYGIECSDKSSHSLGLDFEIPLPALPAVVITFGFGLEMTDSRDYDIASGFWVKGYPYLQTEMATPPQPVITFSQVMGRLWNEIVHGTSWSQLRDLIVSRLHNRMLRWLNLRTNQVETLNAYGSTITITENSIPTGIDSVQVNFWEWDDEPRDIRLTSQQINNITRYNRNLRSTREEQTGMRYGIGGFFQFESASEQWDVAPLLKIVYNDSELNGIDENGLGMYWEDENGNWNSINSTVIADSNYVYANIPYFATYTLAPRLPHGSFNLDANPDSLLADGNSTATVTSGVLYNNDGTIVSEGSQYTVHISRGCITSTDINGSTLGTQIAASGGIICFTVQADSVALPISISVQSTEGQSNGTMEIQLYQVVPPPEPVLISIQPEHRALRLSWQCSNSPGLTGYKIYYDTDVSGEPYNGTSNINGSNSPVQVGLLNRYVLTGLSNNYNYFVRITAIDASGLESSLSNEIQAQPVLSAVHNLSIQSHSDGLRLTWQPSLGAESYKIYCSSSPNIPLPSMTLVGQTDNFYWIDTSAYSTEKRFYNVVAVGY